MLSANGMIPSASSSARDSPSRATAASEGSVPLSPNDDDEPSRTRSFRDGQRGPARLRQELFAERDFLVEGDGLRSGPGWPPMAGDPTGRAPARARKNLRDAGFGLSTFPLKSPGTSEPRTIRLEALSLCPSGHTTATSSGACMGWKPRWSSSVEPLR